MSDKNGEQILQPNAGAFGPDFGKRGPAIGMGFDAIEAPDGTVFIKVGWSASGLEASFVVPLNHADTFMQQFALQFASIVAETRKVLAERNGKQLIVPKSRIITPK